jgi:hypothetical protein
MARKVKGPPSYSAKYYGPRYNSRADDRSPDRTQYDDFGQKKANSGPPRPGKVRSVMRDGAAYDARNKRPKRD